MNEEDDDNTRWIDRQHIATVVVLCIGSALIVSAIRVSFVGLNVTCRLHLLHFSCDDCV